MGSRVKKSTVVETKKKTVFTTTDGQTFTNRQKADDHQFALDFEEIDIDIPFEVKLTELVKWAKELVALHGEKAVFTPSPHCYHTGEYIIRRRKKA